MLFSDKARYNKPITIIVRIVQTIWLANEAAAVNHELDFSKAFSFESLEKIDAFKGSLFSCFLNTDLKAAGKDL